MIQKSKKISSLFAYFAMPYTRYNTPEEEKDIKFLNNLGFNLWLPKGPKNQREYENKGMQYFLDIITKTSRMNSLVFRTFEDGKIGAGVWEEIKCATKQDYTIYHLDESLKTITDISVLGFDVLNISRTRQYAECIKNSNEHKTNKKF